jgi:hypothetical protein
MTLMRTSRGLLSGPASWRAAQSRRDSNGSVPVRGPQTSSRPEPVGPSAATLAWRGGAWFVAGRRPVGQRATSSRRFVTPGTRARRDVRRTQARSRTIAAPSTCDQIRAGTVRSCRLTAQHQLRGRFPAEHGAGDCGLAADLPARCLHAKRDRRAKMQTTEAALSGTGLPSDGGSLVRTLAATVKR